MRLFCGLGLLVGAFVVCAENGVAQLNFGSIQGRITDATGAAIPGATVKLVFLNKNLSRQAASDPVGRFVIPSLEPGPYSLTVEVSGFKTQRREGLVLLTGQTLDIDVQMEVGNLSETVEVTGGTPLLSTKTSEVSAVVETRTITALPLIGRDYLALATLLPGTNAGPPGDARQSGGGNYAGVDTRQGTARGAVSGAGAQPDQNRFYIDGIDNTDYFQRNPIARPSVDAILEFAVQTSLPAAEFGPAGGAVISASTKSGTNEFRASVWEFLRNDVLDARSFFDGTKPIRRRNQFGGVIGGPVRIPGLYDGRNRTFFLFNYEGLRFRSQDTTTATFPIAAFRTGDFSSALQRAVIYDPLTLDASGNRTPFPGNVVPQSRINPISGKLLALWPGPNLPGTSANYRGLLSLQNNVNDFLARVDHVFGAKDRVFVRFTSSNDLIPGDSFSPTFLTEFRAALTRREPDTRPRSLDDPDAVATTGFKVLGVGGLPGISVSGFAGLGGGNLFNIPFTGMQFEEKLTKVTRAHQLKVGVGHARFRLDVALVSVGGGARAFDGNFTRQIAAAASTSMEQAFAQFLLGIPSTFSGTNIDPLNDRIRPRHSSYYAFLQDDFRVSDRLTLNLGLRYDAFLPPVYANGRGGSYFDEQKGQAVYPKNARIPAGCCLWAYRLDDTDRIRAGDWNNFGPRFGFAYRLFGNRTVIRGGYGVYYDTGIDGNLAFGTGIVSPFFGGAPIQLDRDEKNSTAFLPIDQDLLGRTRAFALPATFAGFNQDFKTGIIQQWNLTAERELRGSTSLALSYVGNKGDGLLDAGVASNFPPPASGSVQTRRPFPDFGSMNRYSSYGQNNYHSLQVKLDQRLWKELSGLVAYTWARAIGTIGAGNGNDSDNSFYSNPFNRRADRSVTSANVPQRLVVSAVYETQWAGSAGLAQRLVRGWEVAGVYTAQSGFPYSARLRADVANIGGRSQQRANYLGGGDPNLPESQRTPDRYFRTELFAVPQSFTFGNAGRNTLIGDGISNIDMTVARVFRIREKQRIEFRSEFYNLTNHATFAFPDFLIDSPTVGKVTRQANFGRQIQFGLKYSF
ncbi:MAG: hypothetical protein DMG07_17135 [Acidobacteria bacterium]|nr:MAG: hypothetical protein DMG07_17135 [Acidobacteriota bacterium]